MGESESEMLKNIRLMVGRRKADAKSTPSYSSDLHISVIEYNFRTYDDNMGPKYLLGLCWKLCQPFFLGNIPFLTFFLILQLFLSRFIRFRTLESITS